MGYTQKQANDFIKHIAPMIQEESAKRGGYQICSTVIAQAIVEGACGTSTLAREPYFNHFGLKCGSSWKKRSVNMKTMENYGVSENLVAIRDNFRCYDSDRDCVSGYYDFISAKRYANLKTASTYREYAERLKEDGYATSTTYVNTLCKTVEKYNLTQYDSNQEVPLHIQKRRTLKKGTSGSDVVYLQRVLQKLGYDIGKTGADGIFGKATESATKAFQKDKGLEQIDGIVGVKTWTMLEKYTD